MIKIVSLRTKPTPSYDVYIGRANKWRGLPESKWANPFPMKKESDRAEVIKLYREYIHRRPDLLAQLDELKDKTLACWCHSDEVGHKMCHGDILRELFDQKFGDRK